MSRAALVRKLESMEDELRMMHADLQQSVKAAQWDEAKKTAHQLSDYANEALKSVQEASNA